MSAYQNCPDAGKRVGLASLKLMLDYMEAEARALGVEDAARHIAYAALLMDTPPTARRGLALVETRGEA